MNIKVPLQIKLPENRSLKTLPQKTIVVEVSGKGWNLFSLVYLNPTVVCDVDLSDSKQIDETLVLNRSTLLKSLKDYVNINPDDVFPDRVVIKTGYVDSLKVPIKPIIRTNTRQGFLVTGKMKLDPDSVLIKGDYEKLKEIDFWPTEEIVLTDLHRDKKLQLALSDTSDQRFKFSHGTVNVSVDVEQAYDLRIDDIPVRVSGGALPPSNRIEPGKVSVVLRGGINQLKDYDFSGLEAFVSFEDIVSDSTGCLVPKIKMDEEFEILKIQPDIIYHFKEIPSWKISGI